MTNNKSKDTKGIILAAGRASRLFPITFAVNKQLLPIYDKPMIYYPLSVLMLAKIKEILIITTEWDLGNFKSLLGSGDNFGIKISYAIQKKPKGIADAFIIAEKFLAGSKSILILGDNIFYGEGFTEKLLSVKSKNRGATVFSYQVHDPERYGVVEIDKDKKVKKIVEKPKNPKSNLAVTGLYFYDSQVVDISKSLHPSDRGELEITDVNRAYLNQKRLKANIMDAIFWLDTGTYESLTEASNFIKTILKNYIILSYNIS